MPYYYKVLITLDNNDNVEYDVQDAVIIQKQWPSQFQKRECDAVFFITDQVIPWLINANIKKLEIEREE